MDEDFDKMDDEQNKGQSRISKLLVVLGIALLIFVGILYNNVLSIEEWKIEAKVCGSCHQMNPQLLTWQTTSHSRVACSECHPNSSLSSMFFRANSGTYKPVIKVAHFMSDQVCLNCHTADRSVSPPSGLKIPHSLHTKKGVDCVDCHRNVAHAQVVGKVLEPQHKDYTSFTNQDAASLASYGNRIPMETCMRCHNGSKASKDCVACHANKPIPSSHFLPVWNSGHGSEALRDLEGCNRCHEYDFAKQQTAKVKNGDYNIVQEYARNNEFCSKCHTDRPPTHDQFYSINHRIKGTINRESCYVCHNQSQDPKISQPPTTQVYCSKCHVSEQHPANWELIHKQQANLKTAESCFSCHDTNSCSSCHQARGVTTNS